MITLLYYLFIFYLFIASLKLGSEFDNSNSSFQLNEIQHFRPISTDVIPICILHFEPSHFLENKTGIYETCEKYGIKCQEWSPNELNHPQLKPQDLSMVQNQRRIKLASNLCDTWKLIYDEEFYRSHNLKPPNINNYENNKNILQIKYKRLFSPIREFLLTLKTENKKSN